jgi:hydroxymethylbilane synthase
MKLIAATRKSALALWQTKDVCNQLMASHQSLSITLNKLQTQGDLILNKPLNEIGGKALFMKELEIAILDGKADFAVHSLKDVPYQLPEGFILAAFCKREDARDAFISNKYKNLDDLPNAATVGTASLRRKAQLLYYRPDLNIISLRGNVQTRLSKLDQGDYDAIILAAAGLIRLGLKERISEYINPEICLPAVGQGVVVVEVLEKNTAAFQLINGINHHDSQQCSLAERAFNEKLEGGCHVPVAAHATIFQNKITLTGLVACARGKHILKVTQTGVDPINLGQVVAQSLIDQGASELLKTDHAHIRKIDLFD